MTQSAFRNETLPISTRTGPGADDPRFLFARAVALGGSVIGAVRPDQLTDPTPCADFDVRGLLDHMVTVLQRVAAIGRGDDPFALPSRPEVADDGWPAAWVAAAHDLQAAWTDDAVLTRTIRLPWATMPGAATLIQYLGEITVHTWDLATATDQRPEWDDTVVGAAYQAYRRALPPAGRAGMVQAIREHLPPEVRDAPSPFADPVEAAEGAPLIDRLVAWTGRRP
ncbi:MAG: TIGR03086 family metal-binding protein [Actinomycetota bacterium]|nr:TIGR03086 family metal-binding protein [Actinomycetota bacterium]